MVLPHSCYNRIGVIGCYVIRECTTRMPCSSLDSRPVPSRPQRSGTRAGVPRRSWPVLVDGGSYRRGQCLPRCTPLPDTPCPQVDALDVRAHRRASLLPLESHLQNTLAAAPCEPYRQKGRSSHQQRPSKSVLMLSLRGSLASAWESRRPHLGTR